MKITIGIKALNEEQHIAESLASAVAAVAPLGGEVILADSGSTDRTLEIARQFPGVKIVQLANMADRSCGAGAQLAFQFAQGDFFYLLDGDMVLYPEFITAGLAFLEAHPDVAGVGGLVCERNTQGDEFKIRTASVRRESNWSPGPVDRLDCGGLYRTAAVREAGYFADRNLHAFEEFDLGTRLRVKGWKLARIDHPSVDHFGHVTNSYRLLLKRIKTGYAGAVGEVVRGAFGKAHWRLVLKDLSVLRHSVAVILWWTLLAATLLLGMGWATLGLLLAPLAFLAVRRGSVRLGLYSLAVWNVSAAGLISGVFRPRVPPGKPLAAIDLTR